MNKPLTLNKIADEYDKHSRGRKARTLPIETVLNWAEIRTDLFTVRDDYFYRVEEEKNNETSKLGDEVEVPEELLK